MLMKGFFLLLLFVVALPYFIPPNKK